jgi:adenylyltransferase/sulfurtransferase
MALADLTKYDLERYDRQIRISGFGLEGQKRLKDAKVLVAGAGGLGFPISVYLVAAGIGTIKIVDCECVELSNLNRQLLHWHEDIGRRKVESAREKLLKINPSVNVEVYDEVITNDNASSLVSGVDAVVDALDNYEARYALNRACLEKKIPFFHGAVHGLLGQATTIIPFETACLRCIIPMAPPRETPPILGPVAGTIGSIQATEVIKYIVGMGELLKNRLLIYDGLFVEFYTIEVKRNPACPDCAAR